MRTLPGKYKFRKSEHETIKSLNKNNPYYKYWNKTFELVIDSGLIKIKEVLSIDDSAYYSTERYLNDNFVKVNEKAKYKNFLSKLEKL